MKDYFQNAKDSINRITRFVSKPDSVKLTDAGYNLTGNTRTRNGEAQVQVILSDNLPLQACESLDEAIKSTSEVIVLRNHTRQDVVDQRDKFVSKVFSEVGIKTESVGRVKGLTKVIARFMVALAKKKGSTVDLEAKTIDKPCEIVGVKIRTFEDLQALAIELRSDE